MEKKRYNGNNRISESSSKYRKNNSGIPRDSFKHKEFISNLPNLTEKKEEKPHIRTKESFERKSMNDAMRQQKKEDQLANRVRTSYEKRSRAGVGTSHVGNRPRTIEDFETTSTHFSSKYDGRKTSSSNGNTTRTRSRRAERKNVITSSRQNQKKKSSVKKSVSSEASRSKRRTNAVQKRRMEQEIKRRKKRKRIGWMMNALIILFFVVGAVLVLKEHFGEKSSVKQAENNTVTLVSEDSKKQTKSKAKKKKKSDTEEKVKKISEEADLLAAGYDYDGAIKKVKSVKDYDKYEKLTDQIKDFKKRKENLVEYGPEDVIHIFYHTLVVDTELAFECAPSIASGFKMWMTTTDEFDRITEKMYEDGYVLCSLYDFFEETYDENGTPHFTEKTVSLPEGKKPFILSLDDLCYYHTYTDHGMAMKLVLDENGKITCEYKERDGEVKRGSYDCVPKLNDFMEKHPDGSYRGARGTIALTGYNGIFGYRTDKSYVTKKNLDKDKLDWLAAHPDYNYEEECANAKAIAEELKEEGWDFASHTWGHIRIGKSNLARIKRDTEKWKENVEPIIGKTECIIFAHGQDIASIDEYDTATNKKYQYLNSQGFHIYLNVDSHHKTMRVYDEYVHGGRRNLDGYRLWNDAHGKGNWTNDLFDASTILDQRRKDMPEPD